MTKIAVIGSGVMGRGIAYVAALNGFSVALHDINNESLLVAENYIKDELIKSEKKGYISTSDVEKSMKNITYYSDMKSAVEDCALVIEAVLEIMEIKIKVFKELDSLCSSETILATNTSTMSPTEIGAQTSRPDKVIAMHFFNPVHKMKLIEIVRGLETSEETVEYVREIGAKMKKETVEVNEFPGFITSRMNCLIGNEAMNMLMEGVASAEDIDKSIKLGLNHPMGPLALADLVGLDTRLRNMEYLHHTLGEKYRPCPLLTKYVKAGKLGVKTGSGFFDY
ncbi:3-hydroxyacyl-CoA dehydrogenase NAD-binding domain-containing protein (plasmid) [Priestia megaterium]|uniref:3-hydroxyacyl-CoA dehydrogenase family protein n=1 Tax=Priestia megaterium TaxID=1404 RepID=UPI000BF6F476|nr:3-hydroxyacyl-CoA dehydrogenase NAD-binding domain-containing protein [Priestia megaterium]MDH2449711.1 3-hydroxyacyl-CoA dehydrogenase NAD-binding domain-containing protein [Priestia megaterium]MDL5149169.1 3-hydroxyacyl-CoA dehydrogenase NAD-binding domain-containing protein [Priestia megaterium]PER65265.1 3-hydroxybutyryl-CoA dehydrogenase [Priestia megaterium]